MLFQGQDFLELSWPVIILISGFFCMALYPRIKKKSVVHIVITFIFVIYMTWLFAVVIFPLPVSEYAKQRIADLNYTHNFFQPLTFINRYYDSAAPTPEILNFLMLFPFGFLFYPILFKKTNNDYLRVMAIGFLISLAFETSQLVLSLMYGFIVRTFSIDDLLLNTLGALTGYVMINSMLRFHHRIHIVDVFKKRLGVLLLKTMMISSVFMISKAIYFPKLMGTTFLIADVISVFIGVLLFESTFPKYYSTARHKRILYAIYLVSIQTLSVAFVVFLVNYVVLLREINIFDIAGLSFFNYIYFVLLIFPGVFIYYLMKRLIGGDW